MTARARVQKLSHKELVLRQDKRQTEEKLPFVALLNNIRSLYNVGSIFRTADGAGLQKVWLCGITGIPPSNRISKTALGAEKRVPWEFHPNARVCLENLRQQGYQIVLLEQTGESVPYETFCPNGPVCLVVGNEIQGVEDGLLPYCDLALEIEMDGLKNSLNVTVAFGIAAYQIRSRLRQNL